MNHNEKENGISRRGFVKMAALGTAAVAGAGTLAGCGAKAAAGMPDKWDREADVVVVGFGGSGAAAAIEAGRAGASVLVLERMPVGGGSTALCGGIVYMGGGTPIQQATGFEDTFDGMYDYLLAAAGYGADPDMVRAYVDHNSELYDWLAQVGVKFKASHLPGKFAVPPTDDGLVYSGNETQAKFAAITPPVPRGHHVQSPGSSGQVLWPPLQAAAEAAGAEIVTEALGKNLVVNAEGRVVGVKAEIDGEDQYVKAGKAVILTAGGFAVNKEMLGRHCPEFLQAAIVTGTDGDDGSGIRMGQGAGGDVRMLGAAFAYAAPYMYSEPLTKGVLLNHRGRRFIGEDNYGSYIGCALMKGNPMGILVIDETIWSEVPDAVKEAITLAGQADTVGELVAGLGVNPTLAEATVATYNQFAAEGQDPEFAKSEHYVQPIETAPFYAVAFPAEYASIFTTGGLRINPQAQVLDTDGEPVPGLYSAGRNAFAVTAESYPGSGTSVGEALTFGRIAGQGAAAEEAWS